jgi:hypothetical protein
MLVERTRSLNMRRMWGRMVGEGRLWQLASTAFAWDASFTAEKGSLLGRCLRQEGYKKDLPLTAHLLLLSFPRADLIPSLVTRMQTSVLISIGM